jgi:hypothetical protein
MIPIPAAAAVPLGAEWVLQCPRVVGFVPHVPANNPVREIIWKQHNGQHVVHWSYAEITPALVGTGSAPNNAIRNWVQTAVGYPTDDAGHIIGNVLGGSGTEQWNIFPQSRNFNRGAYAQYIESLNKNAAQTGATVRVWYEFVDFDDPQKPLRASRFRYLAIATNGVTIGNDLLNP